MPRRSSPRRRARRARIARRVAIIGIPVALYVLAILQAAAIVQHKATDARDQLKVAEVAAKNLDLATARTSVQRAAKDIAVTRSPFIRALLGPPGLIPLLGNSFKAVDAMTAAAADVSRGATTVLGSLGPIANKESLKIQNGHFPDLPWTQISDAAAKADFDFVAAQNEIASIPLRAIPGRVKRLESSLKEQVDRGERALKRLGLATRIAAQLLNGDHTVLVILQNSSELRATGGYPDDMFSFDLTNRAFKISSTHFDVGLTPQQVHVFRQLLMNPNFPTSARAAAAFAANVWGIRSDMVLSLDTVGVSSLFDVTGPIQAGGKSFDRQTYPDWSTLGVYKQFPIPKARHQFESLLIGSLMSRLLSSGASISRIGGSLGAMAIEKHLLFWSPNTQLQPLFEGLEVSGSFDPVAGEATIGVFGNALDREWSKLAPFTHRTINYTGTLGSNGTLDAQLSVTIANESPDLPIYLLGPLKDYFYRTNVDVAGFETAPVEFIAPRGSSVTKTFARTFQTSPGSLVVHYFHQPLMHPEDLDIRIAVPAGAKLSNIQGFTFRDGSLVFSGPVTTDLILSASY